MPPQSRYTCSGLRPSVKGGRGVKGSENDLIAEHEGADVARGTIGGFLLGTVVAVGGVATVSVMQTLNAPLPDVGTDPMPEADPVATETLVPAGKGGDQQPVAEAAAETSDDAEDAPAATGPKVTDETPVQPSSDASESAPAQVGDNDDSPAQTDIPIAPEAAPAEDALPEAATDGAARPVSPVDAPDASVPATEIPAPDAPDATAEMAPKDDPGSRPELSDVREPAVIVPVPDPATPRPALPKVGEEVDSTPRIGTPATRLTDKDEAKEEDVAAVVEAAEMAPSADTPLQKFSVPFSNPDGKPLMSIILIDRGDNALGLEALAAFPYPLTFAVDVTSVEALARMQQYRAAGFEVMALTDIPLGATAGDTETLLRAGLRELPEVVAVMEGDGTGLQSDKAVSDQLTAVLQETGHGAVFFAKGLNTAQKLASKNGVPSASVFRDFDGKGQSATVMRRFLDQAAFKARQQPEGVVMVGRLQAETISALLLWGLQDRATRVALAPISALLPSAQN